MTDRPRDEQGRLTGTAYSDEDFLAAVQGCAKPSTPAIAEAVGCSRTTAYRRLQELEERGALESENYGTVLIWSRVD